MILNNEMEITMNIKHLIFDIGDVLVGFRGRQMMLDHGLNEEELKVFNHKIFDDALWSEFDYENIPYEEVIELYVKKYPEDEENIRCLFDHAEEMPVDRPRVWETLHALKEAGYGIYLLSNYGSVLMQKHLTGLPFWNDIDGKVISYQIHQAKPHAVIYQTLLKNYDLKAEECFFFDDRLENVEGARNVGIDAFLVTGEEMLLEKMRLFL